MEESQNKQSRLQAIYESFKESIFGIMQELLKDKKAGKWFTCFLMLIMLIQLIAFLFDSDNNFNWQDEFFLEPFTQITDFFRLLPTIQKGNSVSFYWILYFLGIACILAIFGLFSYVYYSLSIKKFYLLWPVNLLRALLVFLYWALYAPIFESFASIFRCENGHHFIDKSLACYSGGHIVFVVLSILFCILLFFICFMTALLFHETQPVQDDALARLENNFEVIILLYRTCVILFSTFVYNAIANWIFIGIYLGSSVLFVYEYFKYVPYFNSFVSIFWGTLVCCYAWVSVNALLMMLLEIYGHLIIILIGAPLLAFLVQNLRAKRMEYLLLMGLDKMKNDTDALIQIQTVQGMISGAKTSQVENYSLVGFINLHIVECQFSDCPCKNDSDLFDANTGKFSLRNMGHHKDHIFLNHLNKRLYEDSLNKFINSPRLDVAYSFFLFENMRNVHAALVQLNVASKKKPSLLQQFTIYRNKGSIESFIKAESTHAKDIYNQLTNVTEFERLYTECQHAIERVCSYQIEFWTQLGNQMPDLNLLHDLGQKIFFGSKEADDFWGKLCKINANYSKALSLYGNYMSDVKNNNQLGYELLERAKANTNKKSLDELIKSSDILFAEDTVVIHVSGNKENAGRIVKTNMGLSKIFGYSKSEVNGHYVNILMPSIFAKRHTEFLEKFFRTGRKTMFNQERFIYALHRNGFCFQIKILLKQIPNLSEGIQYVAMIRESQSDFDYILTDTRGVIDSFSKGVSFLLEQPVNLFKETEINIQILAPELIKVFSSADKKRTLLEKFREVGGQKLSFMVPKDFAANAQNDSKKYGKDGTKGPKPKIEGHKGMKRHKKDIAYKELNKDMNKHNGVANKPISPRKLMQTAEYKECECKQQVRCEIQDPLFGEDYKDIEPLRMRVFKISGIKIKNANAHADQSSDGGDMPCGGSHSNASFEWKNSREPKNSSKGQSKKEETKGLYELVVGEGKKPRDTIFPNAFQDIKEEDKEEREDTKVTEKLPGNVVTTESRVDTIEAKPGLKIKLVSNPKTGTIRRVMQEVSGHEPNIKEEEKKFVSSEVSSNAGSKGSGQILLLPSPEAAKNSNIKKKDSTNVFKQEEFDMKLQENAAAKKESPNEKEESGFDSESGKSTGRANAKEHLRVPVDEKQEQNLPKQADSDKKKKHALKQGYSAGRLVNKEKKEEEEEKDNPKSLIEEVKQGIGKKSPSVIRKDEEYNPNDFNESNIENSRIDDKKEEIEERKEHVAPLEVIANVHKHPQADRKAIKVPSMLDDTVGGLVRKGTIDEKKDAPKEEEPKSTGKMTNVFIDNKEQDINKPRQNAKDLRRMSIQDDDYIQPFGSVKVPPLKLKQSLKDSNENESLIQSGLDASSKLSERSKKTGELTKKDTKEEKKIPIYEKRSIKTRKKFHSKIITNPIYEGGGAEIEELQDYKVGDEEVKLRNALLAFEKKKNRDKKKEEKNKKKKAKKKKGEVDSDKEDDKDEEKEDSKEEGKQEEEKKEELDDDYDDEEEENQETQSSVTSGSTGSTIRSFYSLRAAIDEKFVPLSIRNLRCSANIVFLLLLGLAVVYFVMQIILFGTINLNLKNIRYSENRLNYLIDINLEVTKMMLITADTKMRARYPGLANNDYVLYDTADVKAQNFDKARIALRLAGTNLKDAQTDLSLKTSQLSSSSQKSINPENVYLEYKPVTGMPTGYEYTIWQAIMEIVVSSFRVATMDITAVDDTTDSTVYFIYKNSLNGILIHLESSTNAILDETESSRKFNVLIFLILLCVASFALVVSTGLLIPVIKNVKMNKQDVLELFMNLKKSDIDEELNKCKKFLGTFNANQETDITPQEEQEKEGQLDEEEKEGHFKKGWDKNRGTARKHKKYKSLSIGLGLVSFKFAFILLLMEGYFLMTYFLSSTFLDRVNSLTNEMSQLISRLPSHSLLLLIVKSAIFKDYQIEVRKTPAEQYIVDYQNALYEQEDRLLDTFSNNYDYHTSSYNADFNNIIFSDVCLYVEEFKSDTQGCQAFNQGILQKGIYSSVIKYWDFLRQLNHDYSASSRKLKDRSKYLNDQGLKTVEDMESKYFKGALVALVNKLESDVDEFFVQELSRDRILFIVYIVYLVVVYLFIWMRFVSEMQEELWKTKSILSILPPELIMSITEIKNYILSNSSTVFFSKGTKK